MTPRSSIARTTLSIAALSACVITTAHAGLLGGLGGNAGGALGGSLNNVVGPSGLDVGGQGQGAAQGDITRNGALLPRADKARNAASAPTGKAMDAKAPAADRASDAKAMGNASFSAGAGADASR